MARGGHYLKRTGRGTTPGLIVSVIVNVRSPDGDENDPRCRRRVFHSVNVAWSYHGKNGWTTPHSLKFGDTKSFWRWLDGLGKAGKRTYCFAPIASDALTLLRFWERLQGEGESEQRRGARAADRIAPADSRPVPILGRLVNNGRPDVIGYRIAKASFVWLSGRQFWDYGTNDLSEVFPETQHPDTPAGTPILSRVPRADDAARLWLRAMTTFADWWQSLGAGPFPRTVPGGAMQFFRSRMPKNSIVVHHEEELYRLERAACHGGRASCWYYGSIVAPRRKDRLIGVRPDGLSDAILTGPIHRVDVRSMYPSLLRDREYPVRRVKYSERWSVDDLQSLVRRYGVLADVEIETDVAEYPHRTGSNVVYPVGRFRSVICGPELERALNEGAVRHVWRAGCYEMGRPFATAAAELCELRKTYRDQGQTAWELLAKLLGNSLAGKLAQNPRGWQELPGEKHRPRWDVWTCRNADTGSTRRFRCIAGRVFEYKDIGVGQGTLTACFAFLTSYGRAMMRSYRETCPLRSVVSQDTDGLWVTSAGLASLRSAYALPNDPKIGELELEESPLEGYWLGPKHYHTSLGWTLAGFHSPVPPRGRIIQDSFDVNPVRTGCTEPPAEIRHFTRYSKLPAPPPAGHIDADGWAAPVRLPILPGQPPPFPLPPPDELPDPDDLPGG